MPATKFEPVSVKFTSPPSSPLPGVAKVKVGAGSGAGGEGAHGVNASHPIMVLVYWHSPFSFDRIMHGRDMGLHSSQFALGPPYALQVPAHDEHPPAYSSQAPKMCPVSCDTTTSCDQPGVRNKLQKYGPYIHANA